MGHKVHAPDWASVGWRYARSSQKILNKSCCIISGTSPTWGRRENFWCGKWPMLMKRPFILISRQTTRWRRRVWRRYLWKQLGAKREVFGQVVLATRKSKGSHNSSREFFAMKIVPKERVSIVEKEVLIRAVGHPFQVQLLSYYRWLLYFNDHKMCTNYSKSKSTGQE